MDDVKLEIVAAMGRLSMCVSRQVDINNHLIKSFMLLETQNSEIGIHLKQSLGQNQDILTALDDVLSAMQAIIRE